MTVDYRLRGHAPRSWRCDQDDAAIWRDGRIPHIDVGTMKLLRQGHVTVYPGLRRFTPTGVVFDDGRKVAFDAVISATGYRAAVDELVREATVLRNGDPVESGATCPLPGLYFFRGRFREALEHTERAIALCDPAQHGAMGHVTGYDEGVVSRSFSSWCPWALGQPDRALERGQSAIDLARQVEHPLALAHALGWMARVHELRSAASRSGGLLPPRHRGGAPPGGPIPRAPRRHIARAPLADLGPGGRGARAAPAGLRFVHRRIRHARSQGRRGRPRDQELTRGRRCWW